MVYEVHVVLARGGKCSSTAGHRHMSSGQRQRDTSTMSTLRREKKPVASRFALADSARLALPVATFALCTLLAGRAAYAAGPTCSVNAGGGSDYTTIGGAVADAGCSTINVASGIYTEQVLITRSLVLHGVGAGTSFISLPAAPALDGDGQASIVKVAGAGVNVEVSGFTISGPLAGPTNCGIAKNGIYVRDGANASIHDNTIADIRDQPLSGCQNGLGIRVGRMSLGTTGTATITNNVIVAYQKGGIVIDNAGSSATIRGNTVPVWERPRSSRKTAFR